MQFVKVRDPVSRRWIARGGRKYRSWIRKDYVFAKGGWIKELHPCRRYALEPRINPFSYRAIRLTGPTARRLRADCAKEGNRCLMWQASKFQVNPDTQRAIAVKGPVWRSLLHGCAGNNLCSAWSLVGKPNHVHPLTGRKTSPKTERRLDRCASASASTSSDQFLSDAAIKGIATQCGDTSKAKRIGFGIRVARSTIPGAGRGLFAAQDFQRGDTITEYDGEVIDIQEAKRRKQRGLASHIRTLASNQMAIDGRLVPATVGHGGGSFINDPRNPTRINAAFCNTNRLLKGLDRPGAKLLERTFVRATKNIRKGEEILASYGQGYWKPQP